MAVVRDLGVFGPDSVFLSDTATVGSKDYPPWCYHLMLTPEIPLVDGTPCGFRDWRACKIYIHPDAAKYFFTITED